MESIEEKLGAILSDPDTMRKIQSIAQSLGQSPPAAGTEPKMREQQPPNQSRKEPELDLSMLPKLTALAGQSGVDEQQRNLLNALNPYLSQDRIHKLENAMRAAKMARLASAFLGSGGLKLLSGR